MFSVSLCVSFCVSFSMKGSIPEEDAGRLYNTCAVFGPDGALLARHRKVGRGCAGLTAARESALRFPGPAPWYTHQTLDELAQVVIRGCLPADINCRLSLSILVKETPTGILIRMVLNI